MDVKYSGEGRNDEWLTRFLFSTQKDMGVAGIIIKT
jgi:hypothetical protein